MCTSISPNGRYSNSFVFTFFSICNYQIHFPLEYIVKRKRHISLNIKCTPSTNIVDTKVEVVIREF